MAPKRTTKTDADVVEKAHAAAVDEAADVAGTPRGKSGKSDRDARMAKSPRARREKKETSQDDGLPPAARFSLATTLSFVLASLGYSLLDEVSNGDLAAVSRSQDTWAEIGLLASWRLVELAIGWVGHLDSLDVAMMDLLAHGPALYLLTAFYALHPATALLALAIDILSAAIPFYLLRPISAVHAGAANLPNRELVDLPLQLLTTALATGIYSVTVVLSLRYLLPQVLVVHFQGLPTLEPAYGASYAGVLPATLMFGAAASTFIFAPYATTGKAKEDDEVASFDPVEATLGQTVWWNCWGYTAKTKVVIRRTAVVMFVTGVNTYLACTMTIYGVGPAGGLAYASVWVLAALCTGLGLRIVGRD